MRSLAAAFLVLLAFAPAASAATLQRDLARALKPVRAHAAVSVFDTRAKRVVFKHRRGRRMPLASNTKLFTAAAALRSISTLPTQVFGTIDATGTAPGDLYLRGGGDPALGRPQMEALARQLHALGLRSVRGGIAGDGTRFEPPAPYSTEIGGVVGALAFDRGRAIDGGPFQPDPALAAATRLDDALEALGVTIAGGQRSAATPAGLTQLAQVGSPPAGQLIAQMNRRSDNFVAEMLTKAISPEPGTTAGGVAEIARLTGDVARLVDGTGLSVENRARPRDVAALLYGPARRALRASLPVAGREGTVVGRMKGTRGRCRVKTGTIRGAKVSALSGYCGRYVFSVLVHGAPVGRAQRVQDRIAARLARGA